MTEKLTAADLDEIERAAAVAHPQWRGDLERLISALRDAWDASSAKSAALKAYIAENRSLLAKLAAAEKVVEAARAITDRYERFINAQKNPDGSNKSTYTADVLVENLREKMAAFDSLNGGTTK